MFLWQTITTTAFDCAFWGAHHDLIAGLGMQKGDSVTVMGRITKLDSYQGEQGISLSAKVSAHGIQHFPKQQQGYGAPQAGGFGAPPTGGYAPPAQQQGGAWPSAAQPGQPPQQAQQGAFPTGPGFDRPPF